MGMDTRPKTDVIGNTSSVTSVLQDGCFSAGSATDRGLGMGRGSFSSFMLGICELWPTHTTVWRETTACDQVKMPLLGTLAARQGQDEPHAAAAADGGEEGGVAAAPLFLRL